MSRWWMLKQYLNHRVRSRGNLKIHSPFVFNWYNKVLRGTDKPFDSEVIESIRQDLLQDKALITITDLGAGSRANRATERSVSQIAKSALKPRYQAELLFRVAASAEAEHVLEFGTSLGITAAYLSALPHAQLTTIEGDPAIHDIAQKTLQKLNRTNVDLINASFDEWLKHEIPANIDMVFFDGNHTYEATMRYWQHFKNLKGLKVAVWDDIYWSKGMNRAWKEIVDGMDSGVAIDLFYLGIVYPNREQAKELFKFRIR